MLERKTYRFRLYPNKTQEKYFYKIFNARRVLYNLLIQEDKMRWSINQFTKNKIKYLNLSNSYKCFCELKQMRRYAWLGNVSSNIMLEVTNDYLKAKDKWFKSGAKSLERLPQKKKFNSVKSFSFSQKKTLLRIENNKIKIPGVPYVIKQQYVKFKKHRKLRAQSKVKTCSVVQKGNKWYCNIDIEWKINKIMKHKNPNIKIGIDLNVVNFLATSNGLIIPTLKFDNLIKLKARRQRALRRKVKFSQNWKKAIKNIANIDAKIARTILDYIEKSTNKLASENETIYIEDLKIKNMTKSASGTEESQGKNVAQKSGLNKAILNQGLSIFISRLIEKARKYGGEVIKVPASHTSQRCSCCGNIDKNNRKSQSDFECISCGFKINADINAAKNILARGKGLW